MIKACENAWDHLKKARTLDGIGVDHYLAKVSHPDQVIDSRVASAENQHVY